ncbi:hypothetical protein AVEN_223483-1 [Araneus ventricosus]|uniref:Uncharacterized protein n=1 Tax=Araneus ventricosus TaxID=182803 RepID=A0A4Y2EXG3_ARAVE|nr:hypothetical protein AVEN_223483-1 [Araneus ventricosus]
MKNLAEFSGAPKEVGRHVAGTRLREPIAGDYVHPGYAPLPRSPTRKAVTGSGNLSLQHLQVVPGYRPTETAGLLTAVLYIPKRRNVPPTSDKSRLLCRPTYGAAWKNLGNPRIHFAPNEIQHGQQDGVDILFFFEEPFFKVVQKYCLACTINMRHSGGYLYLQSDQEWVAKSVQLLRLGTPVKVFP